MSTDSSVKLKADQPVDAEVEIPVDECEMIEVLADEFIERHRNGECPTIEEYAERYPNSADEIRELFPTIAAMEKLKVQKQRSSGGRATLAGARLEQLGDFRIIGEIGRGGMGIVYEAEQESLGRHVAVKVLPRQSLLEERHLKRFEREAKTAARLHHTNIVPIFGVGEQDGYHYYVMQFIRGVGLDGVIAHLQANCGVAVSGPTSSSARTIQDFRTSEVDRIAAALLQGEFQKARHGDSSFNSAIVGNDNPTAIVTRNSTVSGSQIIEGPKATSTSSVDESKGGSNDIADAASASQPELDVPDSLVEANRLGSRWWHSVAKVGIQVADALTYAHEQGTLHRDIKPANLLLDPQGIVWITDFGLAKAMQHDEVSGSGDIVGTLRYMAPEQLQGDADHRSDIYSLGLTLYELLTFKSAHADIDRRQLIMQPNAYIEPARPRRLNPNIPRDLETIVLKAIAVEPKDRYQTAAELEADLQCFLEDRPIQARRASVVERFGRWCRRNPLVASTSLTSLALLILVAVMATVGYYDVGEKNRQIQTALDGETEQREKAEAISELAWKALDKVMNRFAPSRVPTVANQPIEGEEGELSETELDIAPQLVLSAEGAALLEELLQVYDDLAAQGDDDPEYIERIAEANRRVGDIRQRLGDFEEAQAAYSKAITLLEEMAEQDASTKTKTAMIYNELGTVNRSIQDRDQSEDYYRKARETLTSLMANSQPTSPDTRYELARTYFLSYELARTAFFSPSRRSQPSSTQDASTRKENAAKNGKVKSTKQETASPRTTRPRLIERLPKAIAILKPLVKEYPNVPDYQQLLARCYRSSMRMWIYRRNPTKAVQALTDATHTLETLVDKFPQVPDYQYDLSETYGEHEIYLRNRQASEEQRQSSLEILKKAVAISEELVSKHPNVPAYQYSQVRSHQRLASAYARIDQPELVMASLKRAHLLQSALSKRHPKVTRYQLSLGFIAYMLARREHDHGSPEEAEQKFRQAVTLFEPLAPEIPPIKFALRDVYRRLAIELRESDDEVKKQEALEFTKKADAIKLPKYKRKRGGKSEPAKNPSAEQKTEPSTT